MRFKEEYFFCSPKLLRNIPEVNEIFECIKAVKWQPEFKLEDKNHQSAYNKAFEQEFSNYLWSNKPLLNDNPKLIGDFQKNDVFVEIQFGNSATIYRDYYKFHYGLANKLLSLAVLIVPTNPKKFFPTRKSSVSNMAEFDFAYKYFNLLPIPVPILLIGLLPEN
ncbi:BglII/BstYI family type II restriction endonuclease [Methanolobus vulcani]|nr:BglII/BstYI family type II restriction endonuclease [Methanolobus vulcani]